MAEWGIERAQIVTAGSRYELVVDAGEPPPPERDAEDLARSLSVTATLPAEVEPGGRGDRRLAPNGRLMSGPGIPDRC